MKCSRNNPMKVLPILLLLAAYAGAAFGIAGNVQFVIGDVKLITRAGETRALQKGAEINEGDRIVTAAGASAQIKMVDGGFIAVRPGTDMGFDTYRYSGKEDGTESAVVSLLRGGFRTITGLIGRTNKQNYLVRTETATIGIRGTDHEPMVILAPARGEAPVAEPGTYDKVNLGIAYIRNESGSVDVHRNEVGFAPDTKALPTLLPKIPPFYKPTPPPGPQKAAAPGDKAAEAPAPIRDTSIVDPVSTVSVGGSATVTSSAPAATAPASIAPVIPITLTDATGTTLNVTDSTLTSPTGVTTPLSEGTFALEAQAAADAAAASAAALNTRVTSAGEGVASSAASPAVSAAQPAVTAASSVGSSIAGLTIDIGLAASNKAAAAALAATAAGQVTTATTKFSANGAFADATLAVPALAALNAANDALQAANANVISAAGTVTSQNTTLASAQSATSAALSAATLALGAANSAQAALTAAGVATSTTASSLLSDAQTAATAAQDAATQAKTLQSAGDLTGAKAQLVIAQQQQQVAANALANAALIIAAIDNANTALSKAALITADTAGNLSGVASSAQSTGAGAVSATSDQLAAAQAQAPTVLQNSVLAQYNNPAVASGNFTDGLLSMKPVTGGAEQVIYGSATNSANTNYVLDGNKSLVEIRNIGYQRSGFNYVLAKIDNADITFSGGTAKDLASDPNGVYYFGRWQGGQVNVTDLATEGAVAPFSDNLGLTSLHWIVGLVPGDSTLPATFGGPINNTQQTVGTANYALVAATHPTDLQGNVGTLNSATLTANFSSQTLNAAVGLSFSSADPVNVSTRNLSISATANNVPIQSTGFDAFAGAPYAPVINCTGVSCATGYVGSISGAFFSTASAGATTGAVGTGAAIGYAFTPNISSPLTVQPLTDLIQGLGVLSTGAAPTVGVTNFSSTAVLRDELLWPTTQVVAVNPTTTTFNVSDKSTEKLVNNLGGTPTIPVPIAGPTNNTNFLFDTAGNLVRVFDTPHVVFDHGTDVPGSPTSTQFTAPTPLAHAQLAFGGGSATPESYFDPNTQVRFGRWTGGVVNVTDLTTGNNFVESLDLLDGGKRSVQWVVAQMPGSLPITGEFQYTRINGASGTPSFATAPTDSYGNVGTLEGARLSANFTNMTASAGVRISMPSGPGGLFGIQNLSSRFDNAPITDLGFNVSSSAAQNPPGTTNLLINCFGPGCAPNQNYGGRIRGAFDSATGAANTADGAFFRYTFNTNYAGADVTVPTGRLVDDYIDGLVAFQQGPQIVLPTAASGVYSLTAPTAPVTTLTTYKYDNDGNSFSANERNWVDHPSAIIPASTPPTKFFVTDASGNLVSITDDNNQHGDGNALTLSGGTPTPTTPISLAIGSTATATDGTILLGWQAPTPTLTVSGTDFNGCFGTGCTANPTPRAVLGEGLTWVRGPAPFPDYLAGAIASFSSGGNPVVIGTANYTLGASILHDQTGATGTVGSATLGVNFNTASVNFGMTATTGAGTWNANANGIRLQDGGSGAFNAFTPGGTVTTIPTTSTGGPVNTHDNLIVTLTTALGTTPGFGNIEGQLMGIGLGGAGVTFDLNGFAPVCVAGPCNVSASGALGFTIGGAGPFTTSASQPYSTLTPYQLFAFTSPMPSGLTTAQVSLLSNGDVTELSAGIRGGFVSPNRTQTVDGLPVRVDGEFPVLVTQTSSCGTSCTNTNVNVTHIPVVYAVTGATAFGGLAAPASIGTATVVESGFDVATGIRWGRYGGGTIGVNDRITGQSLGTIDLGAQFSHFITSYTQAGPTVLPLTGTFNYTFAGGTLPTDSNGNVGTTALTALNASFSADFLHQTVDARLSNLVVGTNTWGASATGIPITGNFFQAGKKFGDSAGSLNVTFNASSANTAGQLAGVFTGATGNGVGMLYSLNHGGINTSTNPAVTVSGVAAFRR